MVMYLTRLAIIRLFTKGCICKGRRCVRVPTQQRCRACYLRAMFERIHRFSLPLVSIFTAACTIWLGYFATRSDFGSFVAVFGAFFTLYLWVVFGRKENFHISPLHYVWLGIGLRVLLLFSVPNFSDDFYRFLWDGRLTVAGWHPFIHPPSYFIDNQIFPKGITPELYGLLNSPQYFTVYPPLCQAVFAAAAWIAPEHIGVEVGILKLFLLLCEAGTLYLLYVARFTPRYAVAAYALNPLLILEITGNCHFEGAMIFFMVAGLVALQRDRPTLAAVCWALATAAKMLPLLFLPLIWRWLGWRRGLTFHVVFAVASLILFAPLLTVLPNILQSLDLYFRQFQFNASVYYLLRAWGFFWSPYDIGELLGPRLGAATFAGALLLAWVWPFRKQGDMAALAGAMLFTLLLYLSLAATVHPWYLCVPMAISMFSHWRFAILWSGLAALSYSHYAHGQFQENYVLIALEYSVLWAFIIWEIIRSRFYSFPPSPTK